MVVRNQTSVAARMNLPRLERFIKPVGSVDLSSSEAFKELWERCIALVWVDRLPPVTYRSDYFVQVSTIVTYCSKGENKLSYQISTITKLTSTN